MYFSVFADLLWSCAVKTVLSRDAYSHVDVCIVVFIVFLVMFYFNCVLVSLLLFVVWLLVSIVGTRAASRGMVKEQR